MADEEDTKRTTLLSADGSNYYPWSKRMEAKLIDKNCWNAIDPGFGADVHENPDEEDAIAGLNAEQQRTNRKARGLLFDSLHSSGIYDVGDYKLAKKAWDVLKEMYGEFGIIHTMLFFKEMARLDKTPSMTMSAYISKMHELIQKVRTGGIPISDMCFAAFLLLGLPLDTYDGFVRSFEGNLDQLTSRNVKGKLMMEERRAALTSGASGKEDNVALKATAQNKGNKSGQQPPQNSKNNKQGGNNNNNKGNDQKGKSDWKCFTCNETGHTARNCPVWLAFKNERSKTKKNDGNASYAEGGNSSGSENEAVLLCASYIEESDNECKGVVLCAEALAHTYLSSGTHESKWILDSGASDHMCWDLSMFRRLDRKRKGSVKIGDGHGLPVDGIGEIEVQAKSKLVLTEVMYVPKLYCNLVSVHRITEKHAKLLFEGKTATAYLNGKDLFNASKEKKMYVVDFNKAMSSSADNMATALVSTSLQDWHKRIGHVCIDTLSKIPAFSRLKKEETERCDVCVQGKLSRKPFPQSKSRAGRVLELVHTDLMGPFDPPTYGGSKYAIVFTDDHSRHVTVMTMKTKDEAHLKIMKYKTQMEAMTGEKLTKIRSDFGKEYVNKDLDNYLLQIGVVHEKSVPYCQQQNGRSERQNRTLFEMARSMMAEAGADKRMWGEALSTAAYNRNRTPSRAIGFKIPLEVALCKVLSISEYEHMRPFGCRAQAMREVRKKLDSKSIECVMIGYEENTKDGYRLFNTETGKVLIRRDVVFHESQFPWKSPQDVSRKKSDYYPTALNFDSEDEDGEEDDGGEEDGHQDQEIENGGHILIPNLPEDEEALEIEEVAPPVLRRSTRNRKRPKCDCDLGGNGDGCGSCMSCEAFAASSTFKCDEKEPLNYKEAMSSPSRSKWKAAMDEEINRLNELKTWTTVSRPQGKTVLGCSWKFKIKTDAAGNVIKYKARLVAQGFAQKYGLDYHETYSPVVKRKTIRLMLALGVEMCWKCEHVDVISAYINSDIQEELYLEQPEGFVEGSKKTTVCKLQKCLYGLKQSGQEWYHKIKGIMENMGFKPSYADPCLFVHQEKKLYVCLYVDDLAVWGDKNVIAWFKKSLNEQVEIRELGEISDFLSLRIQRLPDNSVSIDQCAYVDQILEEFDLKDAKGVACPLSESVLKANNEEDGDCDQRIYRRAIGMLLYVANGTRPDLSYSVSFLSQFLSDPKKKHMAAARHLMRYLKHTRDYTIVYRRIGGKLEIYSDADHANDKSDRKSFSGLVVMAAGGPIEWRCKKQTIVALSTQHAEYIAMAVAAQEALWLKNVFFEVGVNYCQQPCIQADNTCALSLAEKDLVDDRSKAIDIKYHFIKDCIKKRLIRVQYVASRDNIADLLTKSLTSGKTHELSARMGLIIPS